MLNDEENSLLNQQSQRRARRGPLAGKPTIGMNDDLGIALHALVELVVCSLGLVNANLMRHHETGLRLAGNNQVSQLPVVRLDVTLACAEGESLSQCQH